MAAYFDELKQVSCIEQTVNTTICQKCLFSHQLSIILRQWTTLNKILCIFVEIVDVLMTHHADELCQGHLQGDGHPLRPVYRRADQLVVALFHKQPVHQALFRFRTSVTCAAEQMSLFTNK